MKTSHAVFLFFNCSALFCGLCIFVKYSFSFLFLLVWNLANGHEVEETKKQIDKYKKDNETLIKKNNFKLVSIIHVGPF